MRSTYKTALRAKGIKPIPPYHRLRSHRSPEDQHISDPRIAQEGQK